MLAASVGSWAQTAPVPPARPASAPANSTAERDGGTLQKITVTGESERQTGKEELQTKRTSVGKGVQDIRDIPQSITVVTEKLMDDRKVTTLNEALRLTAGVTFSAAENGTMQDIFIRGFSVAQVGDLLIDGMKDPSLYERETFALDRIEVMRGSASMVFGRGSTGGVVNQVNKKPFLADQTDIETTVGSYGLLRTTTDFNIRTGEDSALRLNLLYNHATNKGQLVDKIGAAPAYSWGIGTRDEFTVGAYMLDYNNRARAGLRYTALGRDIDPSKYYGTASDFSEGDASYVYAQHKHIFGDGGELRSQVRTGEFRRRMWGTQTAFSAGAITDATTVTRSGLTPRSDRYEGTYLQSDYSNVVSAFGLKHEMLGGVDVSFERAKRFTQSVAGGNKGTTTIGAGFNGFTPVEPVFGANPTGGYESRSMGAYVQDLVEVIPHVKLLGGLRVDNMKGDFNSTTTVAGALTNNAASISDTVASYRAGILYQPTLSSSYHLSYGTSFNTSADTYQYVTALTANTPPEKSRNLELGAKLDWLDGKLSTRAALFRTEKTNERTTDADFAGDAYLLSGKRHTQGLELEVVGRPASQVEVYVSYAYIPTSKIDKAGSSVASQATVGQKVGLVPKHSGSVWATYAFTPKFRVGAGITGSSENFAISGSSAVYAPNARAPGYVIGDALVEYKFNPDLYAQFNVSNITNKLYGGELYRGFFVPGTARTFKFTVGVRF